MTNTESFNDCMTDFALLIIDAKNARSDDACDELRTDFAKIANRLRTLEGNYNLLIIDMEGTLLHFIGADH